MASLCPSTFTDKGGIWYCSQPEHHSGAHEAEAGYGEVLRSGYGEVLRSWPNVDPPRSWSLPPEPGPEVTAVRDAAGSKWIRATLAPFAEGWYLDGLEGAPHFWSQVLHCGPLTDASGEVQP